MRDILRWVIIGGSALWLLAGFGAWREGLTGSELLEDAPLLVWVARLVMVVWVWVIIGSLTKWRGIWVWPECLAFSLMLMYPVGYPMMAVVSIVIAVWGVFRIWNRQRQAATA